MVGTSDLRFLWTDLATGIEWKEARRAVLQPGQEEDGWRKIVVVNRLHPGQAASNSRVIHVGDKLVTVDIGNGPRILVGLGLKQLKRMLEPVSSGVITLEFLRASDVCKLPVEIADAQAQRPFTFAVELDLDNMESDQVFFENKPPTPGHVSFPPVSPANNSSRPSSRPKTTSWACTEDPEDPRSTKPLNANRFERLLFVVNCKLKEKKLLALLCDSYELDRPQTPGGVHLRAGIQPRANLRACYRLKRWWSEEAQAALHAMLTDLVTWGHVERIQDVVGIVQEHIAMAGQQYPRYARKMAAAEAQAVQQQQQEERERGRGREEARRNKPESPPKADVATFDDEDEDGEGRLQAIGEEVGPIPTFKSGKRPGPGSAGGGTGGGEGERGMLEVIERFAADMAESVLAETAQLFQP